MHYSGVLFDLFGTLVAPFRMREHVETLHDCASYLGISFEDLHRLYGESYRRRMRGEFPLLHDNFAWIAAQAGQSITGLQISQAVERYELFVVEGLEPLPGVVDILEWLAARDIRLGLVSNCAPELPSLWRKSILAKYFGQCAFSCEVGAAKPLAEIYHFALNGLGLDPAETLYVGDGSDKELSGAAECGLLPVLISVDLSNTYDNQRVDVDEWTGLRISTLWQLTELWEQLESPRKLR